MAQELKHRKGWVAVKELELRRANSKGWAVVGRTSIEQEETAEVIVPDAQPDIWQVWDASTCLLLQRKEVREGQAALYGLLKVTILYQPEGTGGAESMEATLPFDARAYCTSAPRSWAPRPACSTPVRSWCGWPISWT